MFPERVKGIVASCTRRAVPAPVAYSAAVDPRSRSAVPDHPDPTDDVLPEGVLLHRADMPVRWGDMDALGHVNNIMYFRYFEQARIAWYEGAGFGALGEGDEGMVIVDNRAEYLRPIVYPATMQVRMAGHSPGRTSFVTTYTIAVDGALHTRGASKIVWGERGDGALDGAAGRAARAADGPRRRDAVRRRGLVLSAPTRPPAETSADAPPGSSPGAPAGFCERCAGAMERRVPDGDNRMRRACLGCGHVAYENPKNVVGCLLEWEGRVLLCRRGIEPRRGLWTLPAGFMENGESTLEGAAREAWEEATARSDDLRLFAVYDLPRISQVYVMFAGTLADGFAEANEETLEVGAVRARGRAVGRHRVPGRDRDARALVRAARRRRAPGAARRHREPAGRADGHHEARDVTSVASAREAVLIAPDELAARLGEPGLRILDASWYLPAQDRDPRAEFVDARVPGAAFFDVDGISDPDSALPHALAPPERFATLLGELGVADTDFIVVYDGAGTFSAPRAWWNLVLMGARDVRVLDGGLPAWRAAELPLESGMPATPAPATFRARPDPDGVADLDAVASHLATGDALVVDVRPAARFRGEAPEPREGVRAGHMPGAVNLPFTELVRDGRLRPDAELAAALDAVGAVPGRRVVTSCGSGVTAAIATLALAALGRADHALYDGSWSEWGARGDVEAITGS